jgi:hypothetical protein
MKKSIFGLLLALFVGTPALFSQEVEEWTIESYDWAATPEPETRAEIKALPEAVTKNTILLEYRYNENDVEFYELIHRKIWIGDEKTIESYNRLYVPLLADDKDAVIKARVLTPDGKVINLDEDDIQEGKDEKDNTYRYMALTGVQVGSVVEYLFLTRGYPQYQGTRYTLQRDAPIYDLTFELVTPRNLVFKLKSYNSLDQPKADTVLVAQNRFFIHQAYMPKFETEQMAYERASMGYILFALDRNLYSGKRDLSSFGFSAANIFSNLNVPISKKMEKEYKKIIAASGMAKKDDVKDKINALENYLKENFFTQDEGSGPALMNVDDILTNHVMNELGCLRLYYTLFTYAGIETEMLFTSDRSSTPFDPGFENSLFLREDLLYFPEADEYMAPTNPLTRLGCFDADLRHTNGLFVSGVDLGDGLTGIGEVKYIPPQKIEENKSDLLITWDLGEDGDAGTVHVEHQTYGLQSGSAQTIVKFVPEENMEEFKKELLSNYYSQVEFKDFKIENLEPAAFPKLPLIASAKFSDEVYTEPGATTTIVKVGEIIGPQAEMYQTDSVRNLAINHGFPRWYHREITLNVPEGYELKNLESLNMLVSSEGDDPSMLFKSTYTYENNKVQILVDEWYRDGEYPAEQFEIYRAVINAAADFNKKYVVLQKVP